LPFCHASADVYRGLGQPYAQHEDFRLYHDCYRPGLADFVCAAMAYYADHMLAG
jgi:hypothetical protein